MTRQNKMLISKPVTPFHIRELSAFVQGEGVEVAHLEQRSHTPAEIVQLQLILSDFHTVTFSRDLVVDVVLSLAYWKLNPIV